VGQLVQYPRSAPSTLIAVNYQVTAQEIVARASRPWETGAPQARPTNEFLLSAPDVSSAIVPARARLRRIHWWDGSCANGTWPAVTHGRDARATITLRFY